MNASEKQLVGRLKNGESESFDVMFQQYSSRLYNLAFRMCGNEEDAEDIVQRTFVQALTSIHGFKEECGLYTWLYAIAKNMCLRLLENRKKSTFASLDTLVNTAQSQERHRGFSVIEKQYYVDQVREGCLLGLLRCLPFNQRIAFILNVLLGVSVRDTAAIVGKSETATRVLVHRARRNLRVFLCKNCSLYDRDNPCHCENLIDFSLKQGWIRQKPDEEPAPSPPVVASEIWQEIAELERITHLYRSVQDRQTAEDLVDRIRAEIEKGESGIFRRD